MKTVDDILAHVSEKPWSDYSAADYTPEQYKAACLVVRGDGSTKEQCKLPVKTPNGALSRAGVHAAAASLAGARGGVDLSAEERASAKKKLAGYYKQLGEEAPPSLSHADLGGDAVANTTAAIMALPAPLDTVRLVGDEEKHATLLYFGETSSLPDGAKETLIESVKMACSMLWPFREGVKDITRFGDENPPALVAMLTNRNVEQVRNLFLMNPEVKGFLDNAQQFPGFTPHVTLGHPDFAEEVVLRRLAMRLNGIQFDRLSVWWNDERIDCPLTQTPDVAEAGWSVEEQIGNFLEHHGVKGQKWGVRRAVDSATGLVKRSRSKDDLETNSGLKPRTSSEDQIRQDRLESKLKTTGVESLSNKDIQDFSRRLQLQGDLSRALAAQDAAERAKSDTFIKKFVRNQASRQFDRVANKAIDVAIEKGLESAGLKLGKKGVNPDVPDLLVKTASRLAPKKGK